MNKQMNLPALSNIMREFDRQNEKMEMTSEMMGDAVDDAFEVCMLLQAVCWCTETLFLWCTDTMTNLVLHERSHLLGRCMHAYIHCITNCLAAQFAKCMR